MSGLELARLKAVASRSDYRSMVRFAVALAEHGHDDRAIIRMCYGVDCPDEFFMLSRHHWQRYALATNLPWQLIAPPQQRRQSPDPDSMWRVELEAYAIDPGLVPIDYLEDDYAEYGSALICYHLDELAAGRSTIFGLDDRYGDHVRTFPPGTVPERYGPSWLAVLHGYERDKLRIVEEHYADLSNRGFGSIERKDVEKQLAEVRFVEELQVRL